MLNPFDLILMMCGATGLVMVVGSILMLYQGVIKLSSRASNHALEAEFRNQLKLYIRNPALVGPKVLSLISSTRLRSDSASSYLPSLL